MKNSDPTIATNNTLDEFTKTCVQFAHLIKQKQPELIKLLTAYETHETAHDEILRSIETLEGAKKELEAINKPLTGLNISTFFPLNLPLYSLVLFAVMPSAFAKNLYVRPPEVMHDILHQLWDFFDFRSLFPNISLKIVPRHIFLQLYASESDAIIFTGKHENALAIHESCPQTLLLYNGSGVNPFLLFKDADIELAAKKAVEMRCFNSGQDCAGPDAFFVPQELADEFIIQLKNRLKSVKLGNTEDESVIIGPTIKQSYIRELKKWLSPRRKNLIFGGTIDEKHHLVGPAIVVKSVEEHDGEDFHEFFAPFFYVLTYANDTELEKVLLESSFKDRGMYISIFGSNPTVEKQLPFVRIIKEQIVNDVERGNTAYGGYGKKANFILYRGKKTVQPILISRDLHRALKP